MTNFISLVNNQIIIDGNLGNPQKTEIEGESVVQLRRIARMESGIDLASATTQATKIVARNILIYDQHDLSYLGMFVRAKKELDFKAAIVSPDLYLYLPEVFKEEVNNGIKVQPGSTIQVPPLGGLTGMGRHDCAKSTLEQLGFKVI